MPLKHPCFLFLSRPARNTPKHFTRRHILETENFFCLDLLSGFLQGARKWVSRYDHRAPLSALQISAFEDLTASAPFLFL